MGKYVDGSGLSHFMGIIKGYFAAKSEAVKDITRSGTTFTATRADGTTFTFTQQDNTVAKTTTTPKMDGTAAIGTETKYAAGDHVHPTDTTRVPTTRKINGVALSSDVTLTGSDIAKDPTDNASISDLIDDIYISLDDRSSVAFSNVKVGSSTISADAKADTLELVGSNVTLTPDATNDKVTIGVTASNVTTALGNTAVARATADASGNNIASTYATKSELGTATAGALQYKGTATSESAISGQAYKKGWYYVVATAGTYFGKVCEVGDMLIAKQDKSSTTANDWDAVQSNIEVLSNSEIDTLWAAA